MTRALILYGSAARGDFDDGSDIDLLLVTIEGGIESRKFRGVEIQFMPQETLLRLAQDGDLFAIHLAKEGKPVLDVLNFFEVFCAALKIRRSYGKEIGDATSLGYFLIKFSSEFNNNELINRRIAWCVRTIMIAKLAEKKHFIFSPRELASFYPGTYVERLLKLRRSRSGGMRRLNDLKRFLREYGSSPEQPNTKVGYRKEFLSSGNAVGLATLDALMRRQSRMHSPYSST